MATDSPIDGPVLLERYEYEEKPTSCPRCGSRHIADIHYGLPALTPELVRRINSGQAVIAGPSCPRAPVWACADCRIVIHRVPTFSRVGQD